MCQSSQSNRHGKQKKQKSVQAVASLNYLMMFRLDYLLYLGLKNSKASLEGWLRLVFDYGRVRKN